MIAVLDTGAGLSFNKHTLIPLELQKHIWPFESQCSVRDESNWLVSTAGTITLSINVGTRSAMVNFNVAERLESEVIQGCNFCDARVETIQPRKQVIDLTDGTIIPILKGAPKHCKNMVLISEDQKYNAFKDRPNRKVFASKTVFLQPESRNWEAVSTLQPGLLQIEPYRKLYKTNQCPTSRGTAQVEPK